MTRHVDRREADRLAERERTRAKIEAAIEKLIAKLDDMDGDPDLEPLADDEPSLGSRDLQMQAFGWGDRTAYMGHDLEFGGDVADPEAEPGLGAPERQEWDRQTSWAVGTRDDREAVDEDGDPLDDGEEDRSDAEPALGWTDHADQDAALTDCVGRPGNWCGSSGDGEPSLGALSHIDQREWSRGGTDDVELVNEDGGDHYRQWWESVHA